MRTVAIHVAPAALRSRRTTLREVAGWSATSGVVGVAAAIGAANPWIGAGCALLTGLLYLPSQWRQAREYRILDRCCRAVGNGDPALRTQAVAELRAFLAAHRPAPAPMPPSPGFALLPPNDARAGARGKAQRHAYLVLYATNALLDADATRPAEELLVALPLDHLSARGRRDVAEARILCRLRLGDPAGARALLLLLTASADGAAGQTPFAGILEARLLIAEGHYDQALARLATLPATPEDVLIAGLGLRAHALAGAGDDAACLEALTALRRIGGPAAFKRAMAVRGPASRFALRWELPPRL